MAANAIPQFINVANCNPIRMTLINTSSDGDGVISGGTVSMYVIFTAGANGSFVEAIQFFPRATAANTSTAQTVFTVYISSVNTGSPTNANTHPIAALAMPAIQADSTTVASPPWTCPLGNGGLRLATGQYLLASTAAAAAASTAWTAVAVGAGDY